MYRNYIFRDVNAALPTLLSELLHEGDEVGSRAGRTKELTHIGITLTNSWNREVLLPERRPSIAAQIAETMWVLSGRNDIAWLAHYLPRAYDFSDDGKTWRAGYGDRLRNWPARDGSGPIDQLEYVVGALRQQTTTRQAVMTLWDPVIDTQPGKDIPCNDWITFSNRNGHLDMHVALRSNDAIWGWSGINAFEWSSMLEIVAGLLGADIGSLHFSTTSFHLYEHHWNRAEKIVEESRRTFRPPAVESPRFDASVIDHDLDRLDALLLRWFDIESDIRTGAPVLANDAVEKFPEPMLRSWLRVLQWWWSGDRGYLEKLERTTLELATHYSVQPKREPEEPQPTQMELKLTQTPSDFIDHAIRTHNEKHAAYGDSWKRRGEMLGIMANIARKVDRLGGAETADETSADTGMDLMVYLAKYRSWLEEKGIAPAAVEGWIADKKTLTSTPDHANSILLQAELDVLAGGFDPAESGISRVVLEDVLRESFDRLEERVNDKRIRYNLVDAMVRDAYRLARLLWEQAQKPPNGPHSRACGIRIHDHGPDCHSNCPTCRGKSVA